MCGHSRVLREGLGGGDEREDELTPGRASAHPDGREVCVDVDGTQGMSLESPIPHRERDGWMGGWMRVVESHESRWRPMDGGGPPPAVVVAIINISVP